MKPIKKTRDGAIGGETFQHPAFGQISAHRVNGSTQLYDSDFNNNSYVQLTISGSEMTCSLSNDWHFPKGQKIEVNMSESQWATFVRPYVSNAPKAPTIFGSGVKRDR